GTYRVREVAPAGTVQTTTNPADIVLSSNQTVTGIDFGNFTRIIIGGVSFKDLDADGFKDPGEVGLPGVTIQLDRDANGSVDATTTSDFNGNYAFANLGPGVYRIRQVVPAGYTQSSANPGDVTASSGTNVPGLNFGDAPLPTTFSINDVAQFEGNNGLTNFVFTVTRGGNTGAGGDVYWATADGTASAAGAASDYTA